MATKYIVNLYEFSEIEHHKYFKIYTVRTKNKLKTIKKAIKFAFEQCSMHYHDNINSLESDIKNERKCSDDIKVTLKGIKKEFKGVKKQHQKWLTMLDDPNVDISDLEKLSDESHYENDTFKPDGMFITQECVSSYNFTWFVSWQTYNLENGFRVIDVVEN